MSTNEHMENIKPEHNKAEEKVTSIAAATVKKRGIVF
jgi:hypothetical protein